MFEHKTKVPNGGYGWIIVLAGVLCNTITFGIVFNFGIFYVYFVNHYNTSKAEISAIGSLVIGTFIICAPVSSIISRKFGFRPTVITGGIIVSVAFLLSSIITKVNSLKYTFCLAGFGTTLIFYPLLGCAVHYFSTKRPIAVGLITSGQNLGILTFAPLTQLLLNYYDFHGTMVIYGAIMLNCLAFGGLLRPLIFQEPNNKQEHLHDLNEETKTIENSENLHRQTQTSSNCQSCLANPYSLAFLQQKLMNLITLINRSFGLYLFKNISFLLFCVGSLFGTIGFAILLTYMVHSAILKGIEEKKAIFFMSISGITQLIARPALGFIVSSTKISTLLLHNICMYIHGFSLFIITLCSTFSAIAVLLTIAEFSGAAYMVLTPLMTTEFVGVLNFNEAIGLLAVVQGISVTVAIPVGGYLFDVTGNYNATFYMAGTAVISYATLMANFPRISNYCRKSKNVI